MMKNYFNMGRLAGLALLMSGVAFTAQAADQLSVISADPADGSVVESLKQVTLQLANVTEFGVEWKSGLQAPVTDAAGNEVTYVKGQDYGTGFVLKLNEELTAAGTYTISVPAGAFYTPDWDAMEWPLPAVEGSENDAFTLTYTIGAAESSNKLKVISVDPADGSAVTSLKQVTLQLANVTEFGVEWKSGLQAPVTDADGNEVTYVKGQDYGTGFVLKLAEELTAAGRYTISVPAGAFYTPDWDAMEWPLPAVEGSENDAFTLTYIVDRANGVADVAVAGNCIAVKDRMIVSDGVVEVFSISGVEVAKGNGSAEVSTPGIYVVRVTDGDNVFVKRIIVK